MGTNYYASTDRPCPCCGKGGEGKACPGKSFLWMVFRPCTSTQTKHHTLEDWKKAVGGAA